MYSSPTEICRKLNLDEMALRTNLFPRSVEMGFDIYQGAIHAIEFLGVQEVQRYLRINDAAYMVARRQAQGERIYGAAFYSTVARLASTRTDKVTSEIVKEVLG